MRIIVIIAAGRGLRQARINMSGKHSRKEPAWWEGILGQVYRHTAQNRKDMAQGRLQTHKHETDIQSLITYKPVDWLDS